MHENGSGLQGVHKYAAVVTRWWARSTASALMADVVRVVVVEILRYGRAVSTVPLPRSQAEDAEFFPLPRARSEARSGVRDIEVFLRNKT